MSGSEYGNQKLSNGHPDWYNSKVEIWGGVECSMVRIGNQYYDQLALTGHEKRPDDLQLFTLLGIKTIRYPLLWEKYDTDKDAFFKLHDARLEQLRKLNITPVIGLLHHGSGPFHTHLLDNSFPELLAEFAYKISERYPDLEHFTPINEPLTTARFSGLYGHWYPHLHDDHSFLKIFLNEMKGIILSMNAIQLNHPHAKLVQTEDLSKIHSTDVLKYQAEFENYRRWLTYDILTGKLTEDHPLWNYFIQSGITEKDLSFFTENNIQPAICGFNYYIGSERFLDHELSKYPVMYHGGNGRHSYADIEAVRVPQAEVDLHALLKEAWERYHLPMVLTEIHMACTREEQLRWFNEAYQTASCLKNNGVDIKAITYWSFVGSYDWNSLLLKNNKHYECGAYDIRSGRPRATALALMLKNMTNGTIFTNKLLEVPGWWEKRHKEKLWRKINPS